MAIRKSKSKGLSALQDERSRVLQVIRAANAAENAIFQAEQAHASLSNALTDFEGNK